MGLFSQLFGTSESDQADRLRQQALDAFNSVKTPELSALQVELTKYVNAGKLTPAQAEASLLSSNAFNAVTTDPTNTAAQKQALLKLQSVADQGGMTAIDKARMQDITDRLEQENKSQNASIMQQAQQRGTGGSDLTTVNQLIGEQGAANRASRAGTDVAANAEQRALQAMQAAGSLGSQIRGQEFGEKATGAQAQNAIDVFNKQALNQTNLYNVQSKNAAEAANLSNAQAIANANTATENAKRERNAQMNQQVYEDEMRKAQGKAGIDTQWAADAQKRSEEERNASAGLEKGAFDLAAKGAGAYFAGPAGAMAANATTPHAPPSYAPTNEDQLPGYADGGDVSDPEHPNHMAAGGHVHCYAYGGKATHHPDCYMGGGKVAPQKDFRKGGHVPGKAKVQGDSPKNDTVDAKLSPGEVVIPRSATSDDDEFHNFMSKFDPHQKPRMAVGGQVPMAIPRVADTNPMRNTIKDTTTNPVPLAATNDTTQFSQFMKKMKPPKKLAAPPHVPPEVQALSNLHQRVSRLEGGKI
jgi:hypothetical protein